MCACYLEGDTTCRWKNRPRGDPLLFGLIFRTVDPSLWNSTWTMGSSCFEPNSKRFLFRWIVSSLAVRIIVVHWCWWWWCCPYSLYNLFISTQPAHALSLLANTFLLFSSSSVRLVMDLFYFLFSVFSTVVEIMRNIWTDRNSFCLDFVSILKNGLKYKGSVLKLKFFGCKIS